MSPLRTTPFDPADYLDSEEAVVTYMTEAFETGDPAFVADALGVISRARGMGEVARKAGVSRESLYRSLSTDGNPEFGTVMRVAQALGLKFTVSALPRKGA